MYISICTPVSLTFSFTLYTSHVGTVKWWIFWTKQLIIKATKSFFFPIQLSFFNGEEWIFIRREFCNEVWQRQDTTHCEPCDEWVCTALTVWEESGVWHMETFILATSFQNVSLYGDEWAPPSPFIRPQMDGGDCEREGGKMAWGGGVCWAI